MQTMTRAERTANLAAVVIPFIAVGVAIVLLWEQAVGPVDLALLARHVSRDRRGDHGRLPPAAHAQGVRDDAGRAVHARGARVDGRAGPGARLGRRPPQAPHVHRHRGRPALAARARLGVARPDLRAHGLAARHAGPGDEAPVRPRPARRPGHAPHQQALPRPRAGRPADPVRAGVADHRVARRWRDGPGLGRPRPGLLRPPHHVVGELGLPLLRDAALRARRPLHERGLARDPVARRVVAPQPPRLPAVGQPRPAVVGDRSLRRLHRPARAGGPRPRGHARRRGDGAAQAGRRLRRATHRRRGPLRARRRGARAEPSASTPPPDRRAAPGRAGLRLAGARRLRPPRRARGRRAERGGRGLQEPFLQPDFLASIDDAQLHGTITPPGADTRHATTELARLRRPRPGVPVADRRPARRLLQAAPLRRPVAGARAPTRRAPA